MPLTFKCLAKSFFGGLLALNVSTTSSMAEEITIGVAAPLSGAFGALGLQVKTGAEFAAETLNKLAAESGNPTRFLVEAVDDKCAADEAESVANQLVGKGVIAVIGHICDRASIEASKIYADNQIIQISPASQNPNFTDNRPNQSGGTYRLAARNSQQADAISEYLIGLTDANIAIINDGSVYGKGLADLLEAELVEASKAPVLVEDYETGEESYRRLAGRIVDSGATVVFIGGFHLDAAVLIRDLDKLSTKMKIVGGDGLVHPEFPKLVLDDNLEREDLSNINVAFPPDPRRFPWARALVKTMTEKEKSANGLTLKGYAAVQILSDMLLTSDPNSYDGFSQTLNNKTFNTVLGPISFNEIGDSNLIDYLIHSWDGEKLKPLAPGQ